jgi:putative DNA primase/helicase
MQLWSVQRISEDGDKKFLPGGRTKGAVFLLGAHRGATHNYLVEGFATGLSVALAAKNLFQHYCVIVCFSANNMLHVSKSVKRCLVMADNDESKTGELAAQATGKPWVMPHDVGMDFNDLHQSSGISAVERMIRNAK